MASKKPTASRSTNKTTKAAKEVTPVRNTSIPKAKAAAGPKVITREDIALRAWLISQSPECRSQDENWLRAERELKGL